MFPWLVEPVGGMDMAGWSLKCRQPSHSTLAKSVLQVTERLEGNEKCPCLVGHSGISGKCRLCNEYTGYSKGNGKRDISGLVL